MHKAEDRDESKMGYCVLSGGQENMRVKLVQIPVACWMLLTKSSLLLVSLSLQWG